MSINEIKIEGVVKCFSAYVENKDKTPLVRFRLGHEDTKGAWSWFTVKLWGKPAVEASKGMDNNDRVIVVGQLFSEEYKEREEAFIRADTVKVETKSNAGFVPASQEEGKDIPFK